MGGEDEGNGLALPLTSQCITDAERFEEARPAWDALARVSRGAHLYQSHDWIAAWMRHAPEGSPRIFVARRGTRMTAALPLSLHGGGLRHAGLCTLRVAADNADFCDVLSDPAFPEDVSVLWSEVLRLREWHLMDLRYVRPDSLLAGLLAKAPGGILVHHRPMDAAPYLEFDAEWRRGISKSQRTDWERRRRRLQEQGSLSLDLAQSPDDVDEMLAQLAELHVARWKARGETSMFALEGYRLQMRSLCRSMLQRGGLYFFRVALDGDPVSLGMHFLIGRHLLPHVFGFSEKYARFCPVHLLVMGVLDHMAEYRLADRYDFGRGSEEYKLRWTQQAVPLVRVLVARRSPIALGGYAWSAWAKPLIWRHYRLNTAIRELHRRAELGRQ